MPRTRSRLEFRPQSINFGLLVLLLAIATTITSIYISHERNFHWWIDWYYKTIDVADAFGKSPSEGINNIVQSLADERNKIYTLPLVPFILIFGKSRLVYEISLAIAYLLPFSLSMGAVATHLIKANPHKVFWSTAGICLSIPVTWIATFLGIPDTGGAALIGWAAFVYLKDIKLRRWWQIPIIGFCLGLAILLRRHFVYGAIAFLCAIISQALIYFLAQWRYNSQFPWRNLQVICVRIGLIATICFATLITVAGEFTQRAITTNYTNLYASWTLPFDKAVELYAAFYGWGTLLLVAIGFSAGILTCVLAVPAFNFIALFGIFSLIEWLFLLRYGNIFYSLHFTPIIVMGLTAFIWTCIKLNKKSHIMLVLASCYLVSNLIIGLTPIGSFNSPLRPLFGLNIPPLVRKDYDEVVRMIDYLRKLAPNQEPIYVVGSQRLHLNRSMIKAGDRILYGHNQDILFLLPASQVDSQDFYPLETLLQAQYVVVPNHLPNYEWDFTKVPAVGEWLPLKESDVVKVVLNAFRQNWKIAQDFQPLPVHFTLADGTIVSIYQRIRPTSLKTAVQTLTTMQQQIDQRPGGQLDWISLNEHENDFLVVKNPDNTYKLLTYPIERTKKPARSFLYVEMLENAEVTGKVKFSGKHCGTSLDLKMLNQVGNIVSSTKNELFDNSSKFRLSITSKNANYLLLNLLKYDKDNLINECTIELNSLIVSSHK